jgi:MOSC domain-containing protein YiiM
MSGRVLQINVSPGGVPKRPVAEASVRRLGLDGDEHHHHRVHGGPHRAVALFAIEAIRRVQADGHPGVVPGAVGENLTTEGIELARLAVGTRLAVGRDVVLEISGPANPCDVIKGAFAAGKSGRISILLHPDDSRMYARVLATGVIRPGDAIRILPPDPGNGASVHAELDLLDAVEREAWLALWHAAAAAGEAVTILDQGELAAAAAPSLPGSVFNRAFGVRQIPIVIPEARVLFARAGSRGWVVAGADDPPWDGAIGEEPHGIHAGPVESVLDRRPDPVVGLEIRELDLRDDDDVAAWAAILAEAFGNDGGADAWQRFGPILARSRGEHALIATLEGRVAAAAASFTRRRGAWLGGGAVMPWARGRGIQRSLIFERARRAAEAGCHRVTATADSGSASAANLEAMGLPVIWNRALYRIDPA